MSASPAQHLPQSQGYSMRQVNDSTSADAGQYEEVPMSPNSTAGASPYSGMAPTEFGHSQPAGASQTHHYRYPAKASQIDLSGAPQQFQPQAHQGSSSTASPLMYAVPQSRSRHHLPKESIEVPDSINGHGDTASVHSRSALHTPHIENSGDMGGQSLNHRARFDSAQLPHISGRDGGGTEIRPVDFAEKSGYSKEQRNLPDGYRTPPSFSRSSSAFGSGGPKSHPYGSLGGVASKSDASLDFAEGDYGKSKFAKFWLMILQKNIIIRWLVFICPVLLLLWIPGICAATIDPTPRVWEVSLMNWSIWLSIVWLGWWGGMIVAMVAPHVLKQTIGTVAPEARHYIDYLFSLKKSLTFFLWGLAIWVSFQPLILVQGPADRSAGTGLTLSQITKGLFAIWLCSIILLVEKFVIQIIAYNFHKTSYADRIAENKFAVRALVTLYLNSRDIGRSDTLDGGIREKDKIDPAKFLRKGLRGARKVVQGTSTALGTVASEIVGERVLQSNSPQSMVTQALSSANKSRQLARRIFFSFTPSSRHEMHLQDIAPYFPNQEKLAQVFAIFDKDGNGDVSLEELEIACLECHRERLSLSSSMRDLDSAVGRLDQILMSVYYIVAILLIVGLLSTSFSGWVTSASAFVLGLSWLIGSTSQEVLAAVVFLLAKHPYDVGDYVMVDGYEGGHVVKEIMLLSTIFKKTDGNIVQIPHTVLNTKAIQNYRRSGPTSETVTWDVDYGTSFEHIESLRDRMLEFLEHEKRDFNAICDIRVDSFNDQSKLTLSTCIPYKSNWANSALKAQRRNKWICALKIAMGQLAIYGPGGAGNPTPAAADPTLIKFVNPEAAPAYGSSISPTFGSSSSRAKERTSDKGDPASQANPPVADTVPPAASLASEVGKIGLSDRDARLRDEGGDVFDYQGDANREDILSPGETAHAAETQLNHNNTALDTTPSTAGARLNRFAQQDLELGRLPSSRAQ